jgi:SAM-dependent methyltransferase
MARVWMEHWSSKEYFKSKLENFEVIDNWLQKPPSSILEIGCGQAIESINFQKKYNTELWLLDGDSSTTEDRNRFSKFDKVDNMKFYNPIDDLKSFYNKSEIEYTFVDANNIQIPENKIFDVIYSFKSCGFHYPIDTYYELIKKHSDEKTKLIFDIRNKVGLYSNNFEIVETIAEYKPRTTYSLRLK